MKPRVQLKRFSVFSIFALIFSPMIFLFQNCGSGFEALQMQLGSQATAVEEIPLDTPLDPTIPLSVYVRNTEAKQGEDLSFKIELNKASATDTDVQVKTVAGSAMPMLDFEDVDMKVVIPAGQLSTTVQVKGLTHSLIALRPVTVKTMRLRAVSSSAAIAQADGGAILKPRYQQEIFQQITVGDYFACGLSAIGTVKCWGLNVRFAATGVRSNLLAVDAPTEILGIKDVVQIAASAFSVCVRTKQGMIQCWGFMNTFAGANEEPLKEDVRTIPGISGAKHLEMGLNTACVVTAQDSVQCWGSGYNGVLGLPNHENSQTPVRIQGLANVKSIAVGEGFGCALTSFGTVKCWGSNVEGQLGNGSKVSSPSAVDVIGLTEIQQIALSGRLPCALQASGKMKCWGDGAQTLDLTSLPVIDRLEGTGGGICATSTAGISYCVRSNLKQQLGLSTGYDLNSIPVEFPVRESRQVELGYGLSCALNGSGLVECIGDRSGASIGQPVSFAADIPGVRNPKQLAMNGSTCAISAQDKLLCWGTNLVGEVGDGTKMGVWSPKEVSNIGTVKSVSVSPKYYTCAVTSVGTVQCWGNNEYGMLGTASPKVALVPTTVAGLNGIQQVGTAESHACALTTAGTVQCWGWLNRALVSGALDISGPVTIPGLSGIRKIVVGNFASCGITTQGIVKCWSLISRNEPSMILQPVEIPGLGEVKDLAIGSSHACAVTTQDRVRCWGFSYFGELGNGMSRPVGSNESVIEYPVSEIAGLTNVKQIIAGPSYSCALTAAGGVKCWGRNSYGMFGTRKVEVVSTPMDLEGISGVQTLFGGADGWGMLLKDGRVREIGALSFVDAKPKVPAVVVSEVP